MKYNITFNWMSDDVFTLELTPEQEVTMRKEALSQINEAMEYGNTDGPLDATLDTDEGCMNLYGEWEVVVTHE